MSCDRGVRQSRPALRAAGIPDSQGKAVWAGGPGRTPPLLVGLSPYREEAHGPLSGAEIRAFLTRNEPQVRRLLSDILRGHGVQDDIEGTAGIWGGPEPSLNVQLRGDLQRVRGAICEWGLRHNQDAVAMLYHETGGPSVRREWRLRQPLGEPEAGALIERIGQLLGPLDQGVTLHYDDQERVAVIEQWADRHDEAATRAAKLLDAEYEEHASFHETGNYRLEILEKDHYEVHIRASNPERLKLFTPGENLKDYV